MLLFLGGFVVGCGFIIAIALYVLNTAGFTGKNLNKLFFWH
jgi:hypothetical protein